MDDSEPIELVPPRQIKDVDLTKHNTGMSNDKADLRSPAYVMRSLGFDPLDTLTPLQFLVAVMNDDVDKIYRDPAKREKMRKKGITMPYRIEAAKTASRFIHMAMPSVHVTADTETAFGESLAKAIASGEQRVRTKRVILETIEQISPDLPLPEASYPPAFFEPARIIEEEAND